MQLNEKETEKFTMTQKLFFINKTILKNEFMYCLEWLQEGIWLLSNGYIMKNMHILYQSKFKIL